MKAALQASDFSPLPQIGSETSGYAGKEVGSARNWHRKP
jgi:hypothetical protein